MGRALLAIVATVLVGTLVTTVVGWGWWSVPTFAVVAAIAARIAVPSPP
jgi:hypothetical protein